MCGNIGGNFGGNYKSVSSRYYSIKFMKTIVCILVSCGEMSKFLPEFAKNEYKIKL